MMTQQIHNRLSLFRAEAGMSRRELAEKVGVNPQTIGCLERGDYSPSLELAMRVARLFGVPVEALFSFDPFEPVAVLIQRAREVQS
jgi:DNA-binding XRE family transcriptional regulator